MQGEKLLINLAKGGLSLLTIGALYYGNPFGQIDQTALANENNQNNITAQTPAESIAEQQAEIPPYRVEITGTLAVDLTITQLNWYSFTLTPFPETNGEKVYLDLWKKKGGVDSQILFQELLSKGTTWKTWLSSGDQIFGYVQIGLSNDPNVNLKTEFRLTLLDPTQETPTATAIATTQPPTSTPTNQATATEVPPTNTPTASVTPSATAINTPTKTATIENTATATPSPTLTMTPVDTATIEATATATPTATTQPATATPTKEVDPTPTATTTPHRVYLPLLLK